MKSVQEVILFRSAQQKNLILVIDIMQPKQKKKKLKGISPIDLNVNPVRKAEKLLRYSSVRETDYSLLSDLTKLQSQKIDGYTVYSFDFPKGAYLVKQFISDADVLRISQQSLNVFVNKPYRTNLSSTQSLYGESSGPDEVEEVKEPQKPSAQKLYNFDDRIRWANLGYNYDWTNRKYPSTKTPVPQTISSLSARANALFAAISGHPRQYSPESIIVNYYKERDAMTAHLDDAQEDQQSPIYSFSFGLSCVFIIGGTDKDSEPLCVRLDSGDLFVMAGFARGCWHGVPRVLQGTWKVQEVNFDQQKEGVKPNGIKETQAYLETHRININIRQVYKPVVDANAKETNV